MSDGDLLRQFVRERSEPAFAALVERHINLVYSVARRHLQSTELAKEVAQSVFVDLAQGADRIARGTPLVAWLHVVSRRTAIDVVRREARRQSREQQAAEIAAMKTSSREWEGIEPLLDEAVENLNPIDRAAILLRYFENRSLREIGEALGSSEDAAQKRVSRAVGQMRAYFERRGVAVSASGLAADLSTHAIQTAPVGFGTTVITAVTVGSLVETGRQGAAGGKIIRGLPRTPQPGWWGLGIAAAVTIIAVYQGVELSRALSAAATAQSVRNNLRTQVEAEGIRAAAINERLQDARNDNAELRVAIETASLAGLVDKQASRAAFVIDTSGSMRDPAQGGLYAAVIEKLEAILVGNPELKYFQVFDADGRPAVTDAVGRWLPNNAEARTDAKSKLRGYKQDSISNPVPGIERALDALDAARDPRARLHVYVLGDEFIERQDAAAARIDELNPADTKGRRRIAISGVLFPTWQPYTGPGTTHMKYLWLMNQLSRQHGGSMETAPALGQKAP